MMRTFTVLCSIFAVTNPFLVSAVPTFTLGPASNYQKHPAESATPTGTDLIITPTDLSKGVPADGVDFFLGPDLQDNVSTALDAACTKGLTQECTNALSGALDWRHGYTLESRVIGFAVLAGVGSQIVPVILAAIVAAVLYQLSAAETKISAIHLESTDVTQIQSQTTSFVVVETASGATAPITLFATTTPTVAPTPAKITTLSAGAEGHHKGDVIITIPGQQADILEQALRMVHAPDKCENIKRQSGGGAPNYGAIDNLAVWLLPMAAPGELLQGLGLQMNQVLPAFIDARDHAVQVAAAGLTVFHGVAADLTVLISKVVWIAVYDFCTNEASDLVELVLDSTLIDDGKDKKQCPPNQMDAPACDDAECSGANGVCQQGDMKDCTCLQSVASRWYPGNATVWDEGQKQLSALFELPGSGTAQASSSTSTLSNASPSPVIGGSCISYEGAWRCVQDNSQLVHCMCEPDCTWYGGEVCTDQGKTCHQGDCGQGLDHCC